MNKELNSMPIALNMTDLLKPHLKGLTDWGTAKVIKKGNKLAEKIAKELVKIHKIDLERSKKEEKRVEKKVNKSLKKEQFKAKVALLFNKIKPKIESAPIVVL